MASAPGRGGGFTLLWEMNTCAKAGRKAILESEKGVNTSNHKNVRSLLRKLAGLS